MEQILRMYGLDQFWNEEEGMAIFMDIDLGIDMLDPYLTNIRRFLVNNEDWVLGHDMWGTDYGYWYLAPRY